MCPHQYIVKNYMNVSVRSPSAILRGPRKTLPLYLLQICCPSLQITVNKDLMVTKIHASKILATTT